MFSLNLDSNFHANKASNTGYAMMITIAVLYILALGGCFSKKLFFGSFYATRLVLVICLSIIIYHMGLTCLKVNYSLRQMEVYKEAVAGDCIDKYSKFDVE